MTRLFPAAVLRQELVDLRRRGLTFAQAWPVAVSRSVSGLQPTDQKWWRMTFNEQRQVWATNYSHVAWPSTRARMFAPDGEHGVRSGHRLVA